MRSYRRPRPFPGRPNVGAQASHNVERQSTLPRDRTYPEKAGQLPENSGLAIWALMRVPP
jgi:hypothetical protein